jgi:hypothetical protein
MLPAIRATLTVVAIVTACECALAAPRIEIVLATDQHFPATAARDWYALFTALKVDDLQIRGATSADKLEIITRGTPAVPAYKVTGKLTASNQVVLPGGKFSISDRAGIGRWLETLRSEGPERAQGAPRPPFGLNDPFMALVKADLGRPVDFSTQGMPAMKLLETIAPKLQTAILADVAERATLAAAEPIADEFKGVAMGTAIAAVLRSSGLILVPRLSAERKLEYLITSAKGASEAWPIGWPLPKPEHDLLPKMFEMINVEIDKVPASRVIGVISERVEAPVVYDHVAMARHGVDPSTVKATMPSGESMYAITLRKVLFQAGLKYETRADDGGKPFLWITTLKPIP